MQVILLQDVKSLGKKGETVNVNDSELNAYLLSKTYNENTWYKNTEA